MDQMYEYQFINNIKKKCVINTQTLYDFIDYLNRGLIVPLKPIPTACIFKFSNDTPGVHIMLKIDGKVYDPSYETVSDPNIKYYYSLEEYKKYNEGIRGFDEYYKDLKDDFLKFQKTAEEILNDINRQIARKKCYGWEYYNKQMDYIMAKNKLNKLPRL